VERGEGPGEGREEINSCGGGGGRKKGPPRRRGFRREGEGGGGAELRRRKLRRNRPPPPMKSQASSASLPSCRKRIFGAWPPKSCTLTSLASNKICPPSESRRAIKSFTTSCWP